MPYKTVAQKMIEQRNRQENKIQELRLNMKNTDRMLQLAKFEEKTSVKIENRMKNERYEQLKSEHDAQINNRRRLLAELYNFEMENWKREILSNVESVEERKQRIREKAYALKDAREREREELAKQKYEQLWKEANDDARTLDSIALNKYVSQERLKQIEEKKRLKQKVSEEENGMLTEWNRQLDEIAERDRMRGEARRLADIQMKKDLEQQMEENTRMKQERYLRSLDEDNEELEAVRHAIQEEEEFLKRKKEEEYARVREVMQYNRTNKNQYQEEKEIEKAHDAILLEYALRKEREKIAEEEAKKHEGLEAAKQYRKYLEDLMIKEKVDTAYIDDVCKKEEEKVWKARDDTLKAREDARLQLEKIVDEGRHQQIRQRVIDSQREIEEGKIFANKFLNEAREAVETERQEAEYRRQVALENSIRLKQQIDERAYQRELERQETYLQDKHMQYIEKHHRQKMADQKGGSLRLHYPIKTGPKF